MVTAKDKVRKLLDELPDDMSYEDILYHIYVRENVEQGREDIRLGRTVSHEEVKLQLSQWLGR
jgi:hypothetical protein